MAYKLKVGPSQELKLKGNAGFALPIIGGFGIASAKHGGIWTVSLDYSKIPTGTTVNDDTAYIVTWDSATSLFTRLNVTDFKTEIEGTFDGYYQPLDATLTALAALDSTAGLLTQTGADTFERRSLTGTANEIAVDNGDGASGNPTVSLPDALTFTDKTVTGGTFNGLTITASTFNGNTWTAGTGTLTISAGKTLTVSDNATVSGTNTGDQTITLTGDVTGTGTGSFAATIGATKVTSAMLNSDVFSTAHTWSGVQTFTNPVVGTQTAGDGSTKAASTKYVDDAVTAATAGVASINGQTGALTLSRGLTNSGTALLVDPAYMRGFISGLTLSNNATTPNTKLDVAAGVTTDDTQTIVMKLSAGTIDCGTTGANGLDTGSLANSTWYHTFAIAKTDGTVALLASTSATSPTFPTGYTLKRRLGSFKTDGSAHIVAFIQYGNDFLWSVPTNDYGVNNPGTSAITTALNVPTGVVVKAKFFYYLQANDGVRRAALVTSLSQADTTPSAGTASFIAAGISTTASGLTQGGFEVWTNTSGQIRHHLDGSGASTSVFIVTNGWTDPL